MRRVIIPLPLWITTFAHRLVISRIPRPEHSANETAGGDAEKDPKDASGASANPPDAGGPRLGKCVAWAKDLSSGIGATARPPGIHGEGSCPTRQTCKRRADEDPEFSALDAARGEAAV